LKNQYNYIIAGAGCAGLSLLMRMMMDPFFSDTSIAIIDADEKIKNDRTWCFWENEPSIFEPIVYHRWTSLSFFSNTFSGDLLIDPYEYKMIKGIDFYQYVKKESAKHPNVYWITEKIESIIVGDRSQQSHILCKGIKLYADYVFNSILFKPIQPQKNDYFFLQHFLGWEIKTNSPAFNVNQATFMDFRVSQEHGTTFMYVLPTSPDTALIEYTLFTETLLKKDQYIKALKEYIEGSLGIQQYQIEHEESGIIPMTNTPFPKQNGTVVHIGIAGGQAKASSGYAFKAIQKRTAQIVQSIRHNKALSPQSSFKEQKGHFYDSTLLNVLHNKKMNGDAIFAKIFQHNKANKVLDFLDNNSSIFTDLQIMRSVPMGIFLPAALKEISL
jgi:lycopene beta-cyclase